MHDIKGFSEMTVTELRAYLTERGKDGDGNAMKWNTKTRKAELIELARIAHRAAVDAETEKVTGYNPASIDERAYSGTPRLREAKASAFAGVSKEKNDALIADLAHAHAVWCWNNRTYSKHKASKRGKRHARFN